MALTHLQRAFLVAFRECASVSQAARAASMDRSSHYNWLESSPEYVAAFESAKVQAADVLEDEAIRRAKDGVEEPVYQQGKLVGTVLKYSDPLMLALLKAHKPDRYKDRSATEITGKDGGPIEFDVNAKREQLASRIARLSAASDTPSGN